MWKNNAETDHQAYTISRSNCCDGNVNIVVFKVMLRPHQSMMDMLQKDHYIPVLMVLTTDYTLYQIAPITCHT